jgi:hypothetical protein
MFRVDSFCLSVSLMGRVVEKERKEKLKN